MECETEDESKELQSHGSVNMEWSRSHTIRQVETIKQEKIVWNQDSKEETLGFTIYVNWRPTSIVEVIKDLEAQFLTFAI